MYLLDSFWGTKYLPKLKKICAEISPILGVNLAVKHVPCPQQMHDYDCGVMVIEFTKWIANRFVTTNMIDPVPTLIATDAAEERKRLARAAKGFGTISEWKF